MPIITVSADTFISSELVIDNLLMCVSHCRGLSKMPQTSKSSGAGAASPASAPDQGEPPPPEGARAQVAAGDGEEGATVDDQGDPEIVKSPSDPKRYRWVTQAFIQPMMRIQMQPENRWVQLTV